MDIETLQYELSGDMEVASLVKKLMVLLLRISGSTHVAIELVDHQGDRIFYDDLSLFNNIAKKPFNIPASLVVMARKLQDVVIVKDAKSEKAFRELDAQIRQGARHGLHGPRLAGATCRGARSCSRRR